MLQNKKSQIYLHWQINNIKVYNGMVLIQLPAQALLQTDTSFRWQDTWGEGQSGKK